MAVGLYISHAWGNHDDYYHRICEMIRKTGSQFNDRTLSTVRFHETDSEPEISREIRRRLDDTQVLLVIDTPVATRSEWMKFELEEAAKRNIPIVAIVPRDSERGSILVKGHATEYAAWRTDSIVAAIKSALNR